MNETCISQSFNVDDIRRIRKEDDLRYCQMTPEEISKDIHERAREGHQILEDMRRKKEKQQGA